MTQTFTGEEEPGGLRKKSGQEKSGSFAVVIHGKYIIMESAALDMCDFGEKQEE